MPEQFKRGRGDRREEERFDGEINICSETNNNKNTNNNNNNNHFYGMFSVQMSRRINFHQFHMHLMQTYDIHI